MKQLLMLGLILAVGAIACTAAEPTPVAQLLVLTASPTTAVEPPIETATDSPSLPTATAVPPTLLPTATPSPTETPLPTATPHPLLPYTIAGLRAGDYSGGQIQVREMRAQTAAFTQSYIDYPSDGLTITGMMHVPVGEGPFPVLILLHGFAPRESYWSGWGTWQAAEYFAQQGYITIAPDLRSWGESDSGPSLFQTGLVRDVLNLIGALESLPQADPSRVGLWGHSMGGGITTKVITVDSRVSAAVLYAPNSADDADLLGRWGAACLPDQSQAAGNFCNPSEILPADAPADLIDSYYAAVDDPAVLQQIAPLYHLDLIAVPVQIHIGSADG
ncbi:MAG: alpha/beta fold hydrolase, partial [Anaerolineales bacterium]|nr:alpha/beta fold hydrolase [Anaerolineales bacterium]